MEATQDEILCISMHVTILLHAWKRMEMMNTMLQETESHEIIWFHVSKSMEANKLGSGQKMSRNFLRKDTF